MKPIAIIIDNLLYEREHSEQVKTIKDSWYPINDIVIRKEKIIHGIKKNVSVNIDKSFDTVSVDDFIALLIPGG